jgi:hypothetical protein
LKQTLLPFLIIFSLSLSSQKHIYDVELFGKKIGSTVVERIDKGGGVIEYKLESKAEVNLLFTHKSSDLTFDVTYKNGKLFSSYCKNVKDGATEIATILWDGTKYVIKKGEEAFQFNSQLDFSSIQLYFIEPVGKARVFSERLGQFCNFVKTAEGIYECKLETGVKNIYRYKNGILYELEMSKGASVLMKLVK